MKRFWILTTFAAVIFALYVGMATRTAHPMDELFDTMVDKMNETRVVKFKSGFAINVYDPAKPEDKEQWQFKRQGTYDAWSKYLHFKNLTHFENLVSNEDEEAEEAEEKTSLSIEERGNMVALPLKEAYFKNGMYFGKNRASGLWTYQEKHSFDLLELLPLNAEILNRYAKYYKSDNRGRFVVYFFSVDPNYLTRTFPNILESDGHTFPIRFKEGTIKTLVYPDTNLPRRIYAIYLIENLETGEIYEYNIDTYFSEDQTYQEPDEPGIPWNIMRYRK
jgi:hypothetical protein